MWINCKKSFFYLNILKIFFKRKNCYSLNFANWGLWPELSIPACCRILGGSSERDGGRTEEILVSNIGYFTVLYSTLFYCIELHCILLFSTVLNFSTLVCTVLYCTVLYWAVTYCTALHCTVLHCIVLHCTVLYCTALYCTDGWRN